MKASACSIDSNTSWFVGARRQLHDLEVHAALFQGLAQLDGLGEGLAVGEAHGGEYHVLGGACGVCTPPATRAIQLLVSSRIGPRYRSQGGSWPRIR